MASAQDLQPTCEDYDSDQSEQGHVFPGRSSPNAANVSTKRSQASDLNKEKPPAPPQDLRSDSGYSSYTAATVSSTNSAQSASSHRSPPAAPSPPAPAAAAVAAHPQAPPPPPPTQQQPQQQPTPPPTKTSRRLTHSDQSRPKLSSRTTSQSSSKPVVKQRRPTITQDPRPEPTRRRDSRVESECNDPKCTSCPPSAVPARLARPSLKPNQSARDVDRVSTADTRSMRSDPATYYPSPPSPNQARRPAAYRQESAIIQPAKAPRRPSASRPRPMSYGGEPNPQYWAQGAMPVPYPSPPQEHGPPLSNSAAWRNMPQYHTGGIPPYPPPQGYPGTYYTHTPPPYDGGLQRPGMPARINSARNGPGPIVTQFPRDQQYSARHNQPQSAVQARFPPALQLQEQAYESESESETGSSDDDDDYYHQQQQPDPNDPRNQRALVAPPKLERTKSKSTSKKSQRPPMRHANTTQVVDERAAARRMSLSQSQPQSLVIDQPRRKRASRPTEELSRRASVSRPAAPSRQIQSDYPDHRGQMVVAKSIKAERRRSGQVYEQSYHPDERRSEAALKKARALARAETKRLEEEARYQAEQAEIAERKRANRHSRQYSREPQEFYSDDDSETEESDEEQFLPEAPVPPPPQARRRRPTDAGNGKGKERVLERKTKRIENEAEEYISARRGAREPFNETIHNAARHSRTISMPSHSGSSGSERSRSNRTAITNENNEIRLRVDANAPLSLQFNGDMEGRTLRMIPAENGMADLVISGGRETAYHNSDRGSNADDRKALALRQPRRQAEEMTESSSRPRRRRDSQVIRETRVERSGGQRPLRQRAHTASYYNE